MAYKKIKSHQLTEAEMRKMWDDEYCKEDIQTFDGVMVRCYADMFDHIFYESNDREKKDKSILSLNRLEKMLWIKDVLQDETAILKMGWNNINKEYYTDRRVAIVKGNYVVIIRFTALLKAKLVTAYQKEDIQNILDAPDFEKNSEYLK